MINPFSWLRAAWDFVVEVAKRWYYGGLGDLAAGVTFWILLSLPAVILAMVSALGLLDTVVGQNVSNNIEDDVTGFVERVFTSEAQVITDAVDQLFAQQNSGLFTVSIALALWTISRGFSGMIRALDGVYRVDEARPWYHTRVVALILGLGSLLISVPIVLLEVFVWTRVDDGPIENVARVTIAVLILVMWASLIYHYGPSVRSKWRWDLPGAIIAAGGWWVLTVGYQSYIDVVGGRNEVLSAIGAFFLALTWVWLAAQVLLIGAAANAILGERLGLDRTRPDWKIPERILRTGEIRKITVDEPNGIDDGPQGSGTKRNGADQDPDEDPISAVWADR